MAVLGLGLIGMETPTPAAYFSQTEIDPNRVIAIASPYGKGAFQLLILQQVSNSRACWQEVGYGSSEVEPLLLNFDFTGICERSIDSNGYSVRVGGQDLGWNYSLSVVRQSEGLRLVAFSNANRSQPPIEIGRVDGIPSRFGKITLNPGWRLTKRVYNGRVLGHFYLTNDQTLGEVIAAASSNAIAYRPSSPVLPPAQVTSPQLPAPVAVRPQLPPPLISTSISPDRAPLAVPAPPPGNNLVIPALPASSNASAPMVPPPAADLNSPTPIREIVFSATSTPPASNSSILDFNYRVLVPASTKSAQNKVRKLVPGAFRVVVNGKTMMQAGLFRERQDANALQQRLKREQLPAIVVLLNQKAG
ncbi:DUF3747 domain-containing protein [Leptolyngbya sp. 'hensonii']|uniref:DUF3747 domain-containing protein n=1 Tax=Leptolyngbya sp. 'hensonii' TaxID=1922337 RepID=UPI0015C523B5|nr:DUF3747 domain-containing protein [Leptolyngbya sp. 'hensonii']